VRGISGILSRLMTGCKYDGTKAGSKCSKNTFLGDPYTFTGKARKAYLNIFPLVTDSYFT